MSQEAIDKDVSDEWRRQRGQAYPVRRTFQLSFSKIAAEQVANKSEGLALKRRGKKVNALVVTAATLAAVLPTASAQLSQSQVAVSAGTSTEEITAYVLIAVCVAALILLNRMVRWRVAGCGQSRLCAIGAAVVSLAVAVLFGSASSLSAGWEVFRATGWAEASAGVAVVLGLLAWAWLSAHVAALHKSASRE